MHRQKSSIDLQTDTRKQIKSLAKWKTYTKPLTLDESIVPTQTIEVVKKKKKIDGHVKVIQF